jgi:predicted Zn-dependent peptidase
MIGWHKPALPHYDDYIFDVIEALLSRGRTSRFYRNLVEEKGVAESAAASSSLPGSRYPNLFAFFGTPREPHSPEALEKAVYAEIARLQEEPVPEKELAKVKNRMRADSIRGNGKQAVLLRGRCRRLAVYHRTPEGHRPDHRGGRPAGCPDVPDPG